MKKFFIFAAAAAMLTACSSEALEQTADVQQAAQEQGINFDVYTSRAITRAGVGGELTTSTTTWPKISLQDENIGFGVFAFYTANGDYDEGKSTPNFMYNEQVTYKEPNWIYEPVKYWPNEFGDAAQSDDLDKVSFFAYAPYVEVTPTTGTPTTVAAKASAPVRPTVYLKAVLATDAPYAEWSAATWVANAGSVTIADPTNPTAEEKQKIVNAIEKQDENAADDYEIYLKDLKAYNKAKLAYDFNKEVEAYTGDAYSNGKKYTIAAIPANSNKQQAQQTNITKLSKNSATGDPTVNYVVDTKAVSSVDLVWGVAAEDISYTGMDGATQNPGCAMINLTKQQGVAEKLKWNFKHALASLEVNVLANIDQATNLNPGTTPIGALPNGDLPANYVDGTTRIWVRSITLTGFSLQGALNLHSEDVDDIKDAKPNWKGIDGSSELNYSPITFYDGLKDGKEGTTNNVQKTETPLGLNPAIIQQDAFSTGVTIEPQPVFYGTTDGTLDKTDFYVIPNGEEMTVTIEYDVETVDRNLADVLSDGKTHGSSIENKITNKETIVFKKGTTESKSIEAGQKYVLNIFLGLESVKFDATVTEWDGPYEGETALPEND